VVIPARNEAASLPALIDELHQQHPDLPVLVVDDASTDGSGALLPSLGVCWLQMGQHLGIGGAVRAGLRWARLQGHDTVVRLDADGQHMPEQIDHLVLPLAQSDAVVGSRYLGVGGYSSPAGRRLLQRALAIPLTRITGQPVTDPTSGFWAFGPRAVALLADHYPRGYSEPELRLFLHRNGLCVVEAPVKMQERRDGRSTITLRRALVALAVTALVMVVAPLRGAVRSSGDA
jgi:glycosyltransferase involved in cell wall biosynthesis